MNTDNWFGLGGMFYEGFARIRVGGKYNFIGKDGEFLSRTWYDEGYNFSEGFASVKLTENGTTLTRKENTCQTFGSTGALVFTKVLELSV